MLCEKIYSKSHGTKHRAFALSGIYCNIKNDHTHTQTHTGVLSGSVAAGCGGAGVSEKGLVSQLSLECSSSSV